LHVINQFSGRAGAEVSLRELVVATHGAEVVHGVAVLKSAANVFDEVHERGVSTFEPPLGVHGRLGLVRYLKSVVSAFEPDILHSTLFEADLVGRLVALTSGTVVLTSLVNTPYGPEARNVESVPVWKSTLVRTLDGVLARHATTAFHAISEATADHAHVHLGVPRSRIRVVPRGRAASDLGDRNPARRGSVRYTEGWGDRPVLLNVARQEPQKGQAVVLHALSRLRARYPNVLLVLAGREGRSSHELKRLVDSLGCQEAVQFLGVRRDIPDLLSAADVFVFPSWYEGLGGAVVEAAGVGVPIVASDIPAIREVVGEAHTGLVPTGDADAFAAAVGRAFEEPHVAERQAEETRERFARLYELSATNAQMIAMYQDLEASVSSGVRTRPNVPRLEAWP
jgi:glycosyltransferase involved in cell wall biosynthesis